MHSPLLFLIHLVAGWMRRDQLAAIDFLMEQNRVLREMVPGKRLPWGVAPQNLGLPCDA